MANISFHGKITSETREHLVNGKYGDFYYVHFSIGERNSHPNPKEGDGPLTFWEVTTKLKPESKLRTLLHKGREVVILGGNVYKEKYNEKVYTKVMVPPAKIDIIFTDDDNNRAAEPSQEAPDEERSSDSVGMF